MASERAQRIQEAKDRAAQNERLDRIEAMLEQLISGSNKAAGKSSGKAAEIGAVEPYEVAPEDLKESPVLEPVTKADKSKK